MLLNEITTSEEVQIKKINKALKETYGFTLVSEISTGKLNQLYTKVSDDLYNLKLNQATAQDPAYMQKVLVLEGLKMLRDRKVKQLSETAISGPGARALDRVLGRLSQYVHRACEIGDEYEEAIKDAMKAYAIQPYRFDSDLVEFELRKLTVDCDPLAECGGMGMMEAKEEIDEARLDEISSKLAKAYLKKTGPGSEDHNTIDAELEKAMLDPKHKMDPKITRRAFSRAIGRMNAKDRKGFMGWIRRQAMKEGITEAELSFFVEPQGQGATVMNSKGEVHDYYDSAEEARKVAGELNAKYGRVEEAAPPGMEDWIKARKPEFKKRYGKDWERVLYATAWKQHNNESIEEEELEEVNRDRYAEQDWVRGIKKDQAKASGDLDMELSLVGDDDDDGDDYFSYQAKKSKRNEMKEGYVKELRKLLEADVEQAESLIAAKSFSQELQDMIEKLGRLVNEDLPAVADQMRDSHGADVATGFEDTVSSTLNGIMDQLRDSKQELDNSTASIADGGVPAAGNDMEDFSDEELGGDMDMDADLDLDADVELDLDDAEMGDEFGGADELAGDEEEPLGRAKKESLQILAKKIVEAEEKLARLKAK